MKNNLIFFLSSLGILMPSVCYADGQEGLGVFVLSFFVLLLLFIIALYIIVYVIIAGIYNRTRFKLSLLITFILILLITVIFQEKPFEFVASLAVKF